MGGFLGIGNSSAKTDRANQLSGINASWNIYNRGLPIADTAAQTGQSTTSAGISGLQQAQQYWQKLLSGNRPSQMQAAAPATTAINEQADAAKAQEAATGTSRGGGTNAGNQNIETQKMAQENNIIAGLQPAAAQGEASTSTSLDTAGEAQMRDALASLGLDQSTANEIINSSIQSRPLSESANQQVQQQWSNFMMALGL